MSLAVALWLMALAMRIFMPWNMVFAGVVLAVARWRSSQQAYPAPSPRAWAQAMALDATRLYRDAYGQPVELVAGSFPLGNTMRFHSSDRPRAWRSLDPAESPWVDKALAERANKLVVRGSLVAAPADDPSCPEKARISFGEPDLSAELV